MQIEITNDGIVSFVEKKVLKQVNFDDFLQNLSDARPINSGFIPNGCIMFSQQQGISAYVFEQTPSVRILNWMSRSTGMVTPYPLSMPFIYWIIKKNDDYITSIKCRAAYKPIRKMDEHLFNPGLPNFYDAGDGEMCRGSTRIEIKGDVHIGLRKAVNALWDTNWNGDLSIHMPEGISEYSQWANMTIKDPLSWRKLKFRMSQSRSTLGDLIANS